jgi:hypothetical protein
MLLDCYRPSRVDERRSSQPKRRCEGEDLEILANAETLPATQLSFINGFPTFVSNLSDASSDQG